MYEANPKIHSFLHTHVDYFQLRRKCGLSEVMTMKIVHEHAGAELCQAQVKLGWPAG